MHSADKWVGSNENCDLNLIVTAKGFLGVQ